jgi:hypothetical protein
MIYPSSLVVVLLSLSLSKTKKALQTRRGDDSGRETWTQIPACMHAEEAGAS